MIEQAIFWQNSQGFGAASSSSVAVLGALRSVGNAMAESISSLIAGILFVVAMYEALKQDTDYLTALQQRVAPSCSDRRGNHRRPRESYRVDGAIAQATSRCRRSAWSRRIFS